MTSQPFLSPIAYTERSTHANPYLMKALEGLDTPLLTGKFYTNSDFFEPESPVAGLRRATSALHIFSDGSVLGLQLKNARWKALPVLFHLPIEDKTKGSIKVQNTWLHDTSRKGKSLCNALWQAFDAHCQTDWMAKTTMPYNQSISFDGYYRDLEAHFKPAFVLCTGMISLYGQALKPDYSKSPLALHVKGRFDENLPNAISALAQTYQGSLVAHNPLDAGKNRGSILLQVNCSTGSAHELFHATDLATQANNTIPVRLLQD